MRQTGNNTSCARHMRERILDAFVQQLKQESFLAIAVNDVCRTAEVSRGSFYRYYQDKYDLVQHFMKRMTSEIAQRPAATFQQRVENIFACLVRYKAQLKHLLLGRVDYDVHLLVYSLYASEILEDLARRETAGENFNVPIRLLADFCASGISYLQVQWIRGEYTMAMQDIATYVARLAENVRMVGAPHT